MVLNEEEGLQCEVHLDGIRLEYVSEFKYLGYVLDRWGKNGGGRWRAGGGLQMPSGPW